MNERERLGQAIKLARIQRNESQKEFAKHFEVTQQTAGSWEENGKIAKRHWDTLKRMYGVDPEEYLPADDELRNTGNIGSIRGTSHAIALFGGKSATASLGGGMVLSPLEQSLVEELRIKDPDGVRIRKILRELLKEDEQ